jgi:Tfp pilus assembly protein PilF
LTEYKICFCNIAQNGYFEIRLAPEKMLGVHLQWLKRERRQRKMVKMAAQKKPAWFIYVGLTVLIAAVYWPVRHFEFLLYDDTIYVKLNPHVQHGLNLKEMAWAFYTNHCTNWHPLTWLSHMLDWQLFGNDAGLHHVTSVVLHILSSIVLFIAFREMTGAFWRSALLAALFALHPLRVESVAWVAERKDVLSTLFFMLTLWAYARYATRPANGRRYYWLALGLFVLGLMSKPMLVTLPFVLLLLDLWPLRRWQKVNQRKAGLTLAQLVKEKLPFFALTIAGCAVTLWAQGTGGAVTSLAKLPVLARIENTFVAYVFYLRCIFWPVELASPYPHPGYAPIWKLGLVVLILVVISIAAVRWWKRAPWVIAGWLWFLGTLVPVIGVIQVGAQGFADRYTYIPSIGILFAVIWTSHQWLQTRKAIATGLGVVLVSACVVMSVGQVKYWENTKTLFERTIAITRRNAFAHNNLAAYLMEHGDYDGAIYHANAALQIVPSYPDPHDTLAFAYTQKVMDQQALEHYRIVLANAAAHQPSDLSLFYNGYGTSLARTGQVAESCEEFRKCVELNPTLPEAHCNLGVSLSTLGRTADAAAEFREALRLRPDYEGARKQLEKISRSAN